MRDHLLALVILATLGCQSMADSAMNSLADSVFEEITEVPADWPADVPVPEDARPYQSMRFAGTLTLSLSVDASVEDLADWYGDRLVGWRETDGGWEEGVWSAKYIDDSGDRTLLVAAVPDSDTESNLTLSLDES